MTRSAVNESNGNPGRQIGERISEVAREKAALMPEGVADDAVGKRGTGDHRAINQDSRVRIGGEDIAFAGFGAANAIHPSAVANEDADLVFIAETAVTEEAILNDVAAAGHFVGSGGRGGIANGLEENGGFGVSVEFVSVVENPILEVNAHHLLCAARADDIGESAVGETYAVGISEKVAADDQVAPGLREINAGTICFVRYGHPWNRTPDDDAVRIINNRDAIDAVGHIQRGVRRPGVGRHGSSDASDVHLNIMRARAFDQDAVIPV